MIGVGELTVRILLAALMGGLVGLERETVNRPAGFRTHILVCVGSSLMMIISNSMYFMFTSGDADPGRIAAQVVSGIGFLGAGTILREGATIKGLTTAASLWAIAGIGLAVGAGLYPAAVITTLVVFLTLALLNRVEVWVAAKKRYRQISIRIADVPGQIGAIGTVLGKLRINIKRIEFKEIESSKEALLTLLIETPPYLDMGSVIIEISALPGVYDVDYMDR
jgi:putative Mg2+ transporter-C (MgtC) family protein